MQALIQDLPTLLNLCRLTLSCIKWIPTLTVDMSHPCNLQAAAYEHPACAGLSIFLSLSLLLGSPGPPKIPLDGRQAIPRNFGDFGPHPVRNPGILSPKRGSCRLEVPVFFRLSRVGRR